MDESVNCLQTETISPAVVTASKFYREAEKRRICTALEAGASILVVGGSGMGKTFLLRECYEFLKQKYTLALTEPMAPRQLLESIAEQIGCPTVEETDDGKTRKLTMDQLKVKIAGYLKTHKAILLLDDGQQFDPKLRAWLKKLVADQRQVMCVFCTEAPKTDLFLVLPPPIYLRGLPEHCIRDLMQLTAIEWGVELRQRDFSNLIPKASGKPSGAIALVTGEYIGSNDKDSIAPTEQINDATPLILVVAILFTIYRLVGLSTQDPMLYVASASATSVILTVYKVISRGREDRKIR